MSHAGGETQPIFAGARAEQFRPKLGKITKDLDTELGISMRNLGLKLGRSTRGGPQKILF